jgi:hypothetical protein
MKLNAPLNSSPTISPAYQREQQQLHEAGLYGTVSITYAPMVSQIIERMEVSHLLDYGCGAQTNLAKHLKVSRKLMYQAYDPGVPKFSKPPVPAQMVACIDVLEHIEPEYLENVLNELARLAEAIVFLTVTTCAAFKTLSDGRNAHLTQQPMSWWLPKFMDRWDIQTVQTISAESFFVVGTTKSRLEATDGTLL